MPRVIINALWSPDEIEAMKHGQVVEQVINGQQIFHQAERPKKKYYYPKPEVLDEDGKQLQITHRNPAWSEERRQQQAERIKKINRIRRMNAGKVSTPQAKRHMSHEQREAIAAGMKRHFAAKRKELQGK